MMALFALLMAAALLAYANGANDVSKGIATLVGSGVTTYRRAMFWGAACTGLGAAVAMTIAGAMLATFGNGLLTHGVTLSLAASLAAIGGAGAWVLLATRTGLPVSTTHAIVGAIVGAALAAYGASGIAWSGLISRVALPLAVSPIVAVGLAFAISRAMKRGVAAPVAGAADCLCVTARSVPDLVVVTHGALALQPGPRLELSVTGGDTQSCATAGAGTLRLTTDHLHWLSSGAVSFARGLNDAPKIVALALAAVALGPSLPIAGPAPFFAVITVGIVAGSVMGGRRVTKRLAEDVTPMTHRDGLAANLVTAVLVTSGAVYGLPMSTTHVASGGIIGIGADRRSLGWKTLRAMALAWILTVPVAALLAAVMYTVVTVLT